jgi:hypothetical protein
MTTYTTFIWVHACVKDGASEHLHGVFSFYYYSTAGKRTAALSSMVLHGAWAGHYILIPTVYTTISFLYHFTIYLPFHFVVSGTIQYQKFHGSMAVILI